MIRRGLVSGLLCFSVVAAGQAPPPGQPPSPPPRPAADQTKALSDTPYLARGLGLLVYPAKGQEPAVQAQDEHECWIWSAQQTGVDPVTLRPDPNAAANAQAKAAQQSQGAAVAGAAKGAAGGAIIGAVSGNAGAGAAIGAVSGAAVGRRKKKQYEAQAAQQAQKKAEADAQAQADQFKKGMNVCLTGRGYTVQ